jgi:hypothetical protein
MGLRIADGEGGEKGRGAMKHHVSTVALKEGKITHHWSAWAWVKKSTTFAVVLV